MENLLEKIYDNENFIYIIKDLIENPTVKQMKNYRQHYETNCFEHCIVASYYCYLLCKKFKLDYISCSRAAMLHDLFLYDWRLPKKDRVEKGMHAFTHGLRALNNACEIFELNEIEKDMILHHMWPVTIIPPKTKEGFLLTLIDKYCAMIEIKKGLINNLNTNFYFNYFYLMFVIMIGKL